MVCTVALADDWLELEGARLLSCSRMVFVRTEVSFVVGSAKRFLARGEGRCGARRNVLNGLGLDERLLDKRLEVGIRLGCHSAVIAL